MRRTASSLSFVLCFVVVQLCGGLQNDGSIEHSRYNIDVLRDESVPEDSRVLKVAATASLRSSDAFARYSRDMVRGWHMFALWLNTERRGIKFNGSSYSILFDFIDDYSNITLVTKVYKTLLSRYDFFFAPYSAVLSKAAVDVTDPAGKYLMATSASSTPIFQSRISSFSNLPSNIMFSDASMAAFRSFGANSTAVIKDVDISGCGNVSDSTKMANKYGLHLFGHFDVDPKSPTYESEVFTIISQLKANGIQTVMGCTFRSLCFLIVNNSKLIDYNPSAISMINCLETPEFVDWAGKDARGLMMPTPWVKTSRLFDNYTGWTPAEFAEKYYDSYGSYPSYHSASAFSGGEVLMASIELAQSLDPIVIANTVRNTRFDTLYNSIKYNSKNQIDASMLIVQMQDDLKHSLIFPDNITAIIYPLETWKSKQCAADTEDCSGHGRCDSFGVCVCDTQYYGKLNPRSCDAFCDGERAYDTERKIFFCKNMTTFHVGAVTIADAAEEPEYRSVLRLAVDLVNNKTDGYFDNTTAQVYFEVAEDRWECSSEKGYAYLEALDLHVQNQTGSTDSGLFAVIEPDCSLVSAAASNYGDRYSIVQLAFGATSATLSDKTNHPLFARSCPNDAEQSQAIVELLYYYGLKNISVVSVSDDTYSSSLASMIITRYNNRNAERGNILHHESYTAASESHNASFYDAMMDRLASYGAATTVITTKPTEAQFIFDAVKRHKVMSSNKYMWVGPNDWISSNLSNVPLGSLGVTIYSLNTSESMAAEFMLLWRSLDPSKYPDLDGDRSTLSPYSSFALDAVFALALASQHTLNSNYVGSSQGKRQDVYERLVDSVEFLGVSGFFRLDANGDREGSQFQIRNHQGGGNWAVIGHSDSDSGIHSSDSIHMVWPDGKTGQAHGSAFSMQYEPECPAGSEPKVKDGLYYCQLCEVGYYKPSVGNEQCYVCPEGADCNNVGITVPCILKGYWRPQPPAGEEGDFGKWSVFRCDVAKRCLGGCDLGATCAENVQQTSSVCGVCMEGYYATGETCSACPSNSSYLKAAEIIIVVLLILVVFCSLLGMYAFFIHSISNVNIFVVEKTIARSSSGSDDKRSLSPNQSSEQSKSKIRNGISFASQIFSDLKSQGLFVTGKLALSFVQVLLGTLPRLDLDVDGASSPSFVFSVDLNPMNYVPIMSECTSNETLGRPFVHILVVFFLPAMFLVMLFIVRWLISYLMRRNCPSLLSSSSASVVDRAIFDVTLKAIVWFCLFSFPVLASGTLSFFDCRDMGVIGVYMREDYSVRCDNNQSYSGFLVVAVVCVLLYPIGIPLFFYRLIRDRDEEWARTGSKALHMNFLPEWAYFEVFELFRKLMLTSIVAFVVPGTATQVMYLFAVDMIALLVLVACRPYASDPDDFLSVVLVLTECTLFFMAFLIVSEVYTAENYSKAGMFNTCLSLIILALAFFVPMNLVAKIPSVHRLVESWSGIVTVQLSKLGIKVSSIRKLDVPSQQEIKELPESIIKITATDIHVEGPGLGSNDEAQEKKQVAPSHGLLRELRGRDPMQGDENGDIELAVRSLKARCGSDAVISHVDNSA